jgi:hypothetical protein
MKSTAILSAFSAILALLAPVNAAPLLPRNPAPLASHLGAPGVFYRAVTGGEMAVAKDVYKVGQAPASYLKVPGDLSPTGGLYVFKVSLHKR